MGSGALRKDILHDNARDAHSSPAAGNWACQLILRAQTLGRLAPFYASGFVVIDAAPHCDQTSQRVQRGWDDKYFSPGSCPSAGAKLCTYHCWLLLPSPLAGPYFHLPLSRHSLRHMRSFNGVPIPFPLTKDVTNTRPLPSGLHAT